MKPVPMQTMYVPPVCVDLEDDFRPSMIRSREVGLLYVLSDASTLNNIVCFVLANEESGPDAQATERTLREAREVAEVLTLGPEALTVLRELVESPNAKDNALWDRARMVLAKVGRMCRRCGQRPAQEGNPGPWCDTCTAS